MQLQKIEKRSMKTIRWSKILEVLTPKYWISENFAFLSIHSCTVRLFQSKVNSIQTHTLTHNITGFLHLRLFSNSTYSLFSSKAF